MLLNFCTLFDSNYLDKGLVLMDSLYESCKAYNLYVLPMDKKCFEILSRLELPNVIVVDYDDFEDADLVSVKNERTRAEFCWTCTAKLIQYIFRKYQVEICTYIDADLFFYKDPYILIEEMLQEKKSVQIVRHNFCRYERKYNEKKSGIYCVEFNTFLNDQDGNKVLESWVADCLNDCSYGKNEEVLGDQKYLNKWLEIYNCINVLGNLGAGIAPWNINRFKIQSINKKLYYTDSETHKKGEIVFYHFQNVRFRDESHVYCCDVLKSNYPGATILYEHYLSRIMKKKRMLKNQFDLNLYLYEHPADMENRYGKNNIPRKKLDRFRNMTIHKFIAKINRKLVVLLYYKRMKAVTIDIHEEIRV